MQFFHTGIFHPKDSQQKLLKLGDDHVIAEHIRSIVFLQDLQQQIAGFVVQRKTLIQKQFQKRILNIKGYGDKTDRASRICILHMPLPGAVNRHVPCSRAISLPFTTL